MEYDSPFHPYQSFQTSLQTVHKYTFQLLTRNLGTYFNTCVKCVFMKYLPCPSVRKKIERLLDVEHLTGSSERWRWLPHQCRNLSLLHEEFPHQWRHWSPGQDIQLVISGINNWLFVSSTFHFHQFYLYNKKSDKNVIASKSCAFYFIDGINKVVQAWLYFLY